MESWSGLLSTSLLLFHLLLACEARPAPPPLEAPPEGASGRQTEKASSSGKAMVSAANPLAVDAGLSMLSQGGSAMDAAIATQLALNVVEPQSSGIGGGGFLLAFSASTGSVHAYDGRETAPAKATSSQFLDKAGNGLPFLEAAVGGQSVGVPGLLRMLEMAHARHGRLPWERLFEPAIHLAEAGFPMSPRLHSLLKEASGFAFMKGADLYFNPASRQPLPVGTRVRNPELAATFRQIASGGVEAFYAGSLAQAIAEAVAQAKCPSSRESSTTPGLHSCKGELSAEDLIRYKALERPPVCGSYRSYRVCGMGPPSGGGVAVLQMLAFLEPHGLSELPPESPALLHLLAEASRLAFADRDRYLADPAFFPVPLQGLLSPSYLRARAGLLSPARANPSAKAGVPNGAPGNTTGQWLPNGFSLELPSTTHLVVWDATGDVVSFTSSIENAFGSRVMVGGFLLNNQLTDFSFAPASEPVANALSPGKRPRSSMAPLIVLDAKTGEPVLALGSPGGSRIIPYVARALVAILDQQLEPQDAVSLPHVVGKGATTELEREGWHTESLETVKSALTAMGHQVVVTDQTSGLHVVMRRGEALHGGADPRREGIAKSIELNTK